ncbi:MAG: ankyrin repeat domain-containing protein [Leptospirales bacterium]
MSEKRILYIISMCILVIGMSCMKKYSVENFFLYIENGNIDAIQELLENPENVNFTDRSGKTALMHSIVNGAINKPLTLHYEIIQLFFEFGANVNRVDHNGWSALFYALMENDEKAFLLLLENGADFHIDIYGKTLFSHAIELNKPAFVEILRLYK